MYETREFWRKAALESKNPDVVKKDKEKYVLAYNTTTKKSLSMSYLDFSSLNEFMNELEKVKAMAKDLDINRISISTRSTDEEAFDVHMDKILAKKVVELSRCGIKLNQNIVNKLSEKGLPKGYTSDQIEFDKLGKEVYKLIVDHFPDAFASTIEEAGDIITNSYNSGISQENIQSFFVIKYDNKIVGFAKSSQFTQGVREGLLHLTIAVTHRNHRKKGLYKWLLKLRLQAGMDNNAKFVYTESDVTTSGPILERMGLKEFERIKIFHKKI